MNKCLASSLLTALSAILLTSSLMDDGKGQIGALQAQNSALQGAFNEMLARTVQKHEQAADALIDARRAAETARMEAESAKKKWEGQAGACR